MARFHELALLCHEHADQYKLPDLDVENSFQNIIEQKVDKKYETYNQRQARRQKRAAAGEPEEEEEEDNMFLPGLSGDALSSREERYYELVAKYRGNDPEFADGVQDEGWFCLPCNIKDEVYSKPPSYRHIHSNRYDPNHRPAKIVTSGEICQCIGFCGKFLFSEKGGAERKAVFCVQSSAFSLLKKLTVASDYYFAQVTIA